VYAFANIGYFSMSQGKKLTLSYIYIIKFYHIRILTWQKGKNMPPKHPLHFPLQKKYGLTNRALAALIGANETTIASFMNQNVQEFPRIEKRLSKLLAHLKCHFPIEWSG
jgi:1-deoxy-D-xylulose 5-phosphate reductoisomerase